MDNNSTHTNGNRKVAPKATASMLRRRATERADPSPSTRGWHDPTASRATGQSDAAERVRQFPGRQRHELRRGVGDLADPVDARSQSPRLGGTMLNVDEGRLLASGESITGVYRCREAIRSSAPRLMYYKRLVEVLARVAAAQSEMDHEREIGEAARVRAAR